MMKKLFLLTVIVLICFGLFYFLSVISCDAKGEKGRKTVYIVPDLSTYIYYVSLWDKDSWVPIFLEDDKYLKKFLKSYGTAKVEKVESKEIGEINTGLVYRALYASWGPENVTEIDEEITKDKLKNRLKEIGVEPEGIVITNLNSKEFAGGLALAAAHKEILDFYESDAPYVSSLNTYEMSTTFEKKEKIRKDLIKILDSWGYEYAGLGRGIDYITLALDISLGCKNYNHLEPSRGVRPGFSLDDAINRLIAGVIDPKARPSQKRSNCYAYVGRLLEAEKNMAVYQAMCSLFLEVDKMLYFDQWPPKHGMGCADGVYIIGDKAKTTLVPPGKSTIEKWRKVTGRESQYDFIHVNSSGSAKKWRDGEVSDIPQSIPAIVYFAQSMSARDPKDNDTIAGRWLRNGAYIYYGSITEPYAESFNSAKNVARSIVKNEPLGKAFQQKETLIVPFTYPWKLVYIGDPLHRIKFSSR